MEKTWKRVSAYGGMTVSLVALAVALIYGKKREYRIYRKKKLNGNKDITFVLIPDGGHGAWCYDRIVPYLEQAGAGVFALTLPGVGEKEQELSPAIGLEDHIQTVVEFIKEEKLKDVILVGHNYGGMVITGAADRLPESVRHLVFLDIMPPTDGQSFFEAQPYATFVTPVNGRRHVRGTEVNLIPDAKMMDYLRLKDMDDIIWVTQHLTPHPYKTYADSLHLANQGIIEKMEHTLLFTKYTMDGLVGLNAISRSLMKKAWVIDSTHELMITEPELVANLLLKITEKGKGILR